MGKTALFAISAFVVIGAYYGSNVQNTMLASSDNISEHQYTVVARNVALTGYNMATQRLAGNFASANLTGTFEDGFYSAKITVNGDVATVNVVGQVFDQDGALHSYNINAKFERQTSYSQPEESPDYLRYGLITEQDLTLNGNVLFDTLMVAGTETAKYNANIHTNGKLTVKGNSATIRGFGTYKVSKDIQHLRVFQPYYNPTLEPVVKQVAAGIAIPVADLDPNQYKTRVTVDQTTVGDVELNPAHDFKAYGATRDDPYVWYIDGDLSVTQNTTITGYVTFLVTGMITFDGNVQVGTFDGPAENNFAFYSNGGIEIKGNAQALWAQIATTGNVTFSGTPKVFGSVTAAGSATISGTPDIYFFPSSPALAPPQPDTRLKLLSYLEGERIVS